MKTNFSVEAVRARLQQPLQAILPRVMPHVLCGAVGFLAARAPVLGIYTPFAGAWTAAAPYPWLAAAVIGAVLGSVSLPLSAGVTAMCGVLITAVARRLLSEWKRLSAHPLFAPLNAGSAVLLTEVLIGDALMAKLTPINLLCEVLLACGGAWFFERAATAVFRRGGFAAADLPARAGCALVCGVLLAALSASKVGPISLGNVLTLLLLVFCAVQGGVTGGCVCGTAAGTVLAVSVGTGDLFPIGYAFVGLVIGCFAPLGRVAAALTLVASNGVLVLLFRDAPSAALLESVAAAGLFLLIPQRLQTHLANAVFRESEHASPEYMRRSVAMRLDFAARAIAHVSQSVEEVSKQLLKHCAPSISGVYDRAVADACGNCGLRMLCWQTQHDATTAALNHVTPVLVQKGRVSRSDLPEDLRTVCKRPDRLAEAITGHYEDYMNNEAAEQRIAEIRSVVASQFRGVSDMLQELADSFRRQMVCDEKSSRAVRDCLIRAGWSPEGVVCSCDENDRMLVEICARQERRFRTNFRALARELEQACGRRFGAPGITHSGGVTRISLSERTAFEADVGSVQHICSGAQLCGDHYTFFYDGGGRAVMTLSDGMGSGGRAAVDAAMACGILSRLVLSGLGYDCALRIINSSLYVKSGDESLATVDVATVDLYTGRAVFRKAGAAVGFVRHGGQVEVIDLASLPAGILQDIRFAVHEQQLEPGDVIVLVSDGALTGENDWLIERLRNWRGSAQELSEELLTVAVTRRDGAHDDDITVAALQLRAV